MSPVLASDEEIIERVTECYADGETLDAGGVLPETVAADLPIARKTAQTKLSVLADEGRLERDFGFKDKRQRVGYSPVQDAEAPAETAVGGAD